MTGSDLELSWREEGGGAVLFDLSCQLFFLM